jgi:hypothetical protein
MTVDAPIPFPLTRTGRGEGPLVLKIKKNIKNTEIAPAGRRTFPFSDKDRSDRGAARTKY